MHAHYIKEGCILAMESGRPNDRPRILIPSRTLIVLSGPAGSGKSTFARRLVEAHNTQDLRETMIVSSDRCRAMVCDDENSQSVNRDAFDLFHYIIHKRLLQQRLTIADSTALTLDARLHLLDIARRHNYHTCLLLLQVPRDTILQQNQMRTRVVDEPVIAFHLEQFQQALTSVPTEGWNQYHILQGPEPRVKLIIKTPPEEPAQNRPAIQ